MKRAAVLLVTSVLACRAYAQDLPRETTKIPGSEIAFEMVRIPGGAQLRPFWIGTREVTWGEFDFYYETRDLAGVDGLTHPTKGKSYLQQTGLPDEFLHAKRPAISVRWHSAMAYCEWLSRKTGHRYRLPTEAEWELASRAGASDPAPAELDGLAWYAANSKEATHAVGEKKPNAFGLYDTLGNAWEYCLESAHPEDFVPMLKGGGWNAAADAVLVSGRKTIPLAWFEADPNRPRSVWWCAGGYCQGFRVVRLDGPCTKDELAAYQGKIGITIEKGEKKVLKTEGAPEFFCRITGEVKNGGDRSLDELELAVYYLNPAGDPHWVDVQGANKPGAATFGKCYPALANGTGGSPLKPGETRRFQLNIPRSFDGEDNVAKEKFGARVTALQFSPEK